MGPALSLDFWVSWPTREARWGMLVILAEWARCKGQSGPDAKWNHLLQSVIVIYTNPMLVNYNKALHRTFTLCMHGVMTYSKTYIYIHTYIYMHIYIHTYVLNLCFFDMQLKSQVSLYILRLTWDKSKRIHALGQLLPLSWHLMMMSFCASDKALSC